MIVEILGTGKANARPSRELCEILGIDRRELCEEIARERRAGFVICASREKSNSGYYIAATAEEARHQIATLSASAREMLLVAQAMAEAIGDEIAG